MTHASGRSNFSSDQPDGAFWLYALSPGVVHACSTNAAGVILAIRQALGLAPLPAWDTTVISALRNRAASLASSSPAWGPVAERLNREGDRVSRLAILLGIYLAFYEPHGLRFDAIALPDSTDMPSMGVSIPGEPQPVACWNPAADPDPSLATSDRSQAVSETAGGVRVRPGGPPIRDLVSSSPYSGPSDTVAAALVIAAIVAAIFLFRDKR